MKAFPETSHYTLDMPNQPGAFPSFYVDQLKCYVLNDPTLFPGCKRHMLEPTIVDGHEEFFIDCILVSSPC
ncbi:hypothetical protein GG344DRAFT_26535, partial [Lentinula edodes]